MATLVPELAQKAMTHVVNHICQEIIFERCSKEKYWPTVEYFQKCIPNSLYAILAQCRVIDLETTTTEGWLELVELMAPLEDEFDDKPNYSKTLRLLRMQVIASHYRGEERADKSNLISAYKALESNPAYNIVKDVIEQEGEDREAAMNHKTLTLEYFAEKVFGIYLKKLVHSLGFVDRPTSLNIVPGRTGPRRKRKKARKLEVAAKAPDPERETTVEIDDNSSNDDGEPAKQPALEGNNNFLPSNHDEEEIEHPMDKENSNEAIKKLKSARKHLREGGTDPLQEIREVARQAKRPCNTNTLYEKKTTARTLDFDDECELEGIKLSSVPSKLNHPSPTTAVNYAAGTVSRQPGTRLKWTTEEKNAVKQGLVKFGLGCWREIKVEYCEILKHRTAVNIKDCVRTMKSNGELSAAER